MTVAVLMGTCQGESFLAEQLDSLAGQTLTDWQLWVSDDASVDATPEILERYRQRALRGRMQVVQGPAQGLAANFLSLICRPQIVADHYAYADQDDVWDSDKLQRAVAWLDTVPASVPALYCSRTRLVDADNGEIGLSLLFRRPPCFANALVQNVGGGNTMVFNHAARALLVRAGDAVKVAAHDWWTYLLIAGCGGRVHYDAHPTLRYRQHGDNLMGANTTWRARFQRICLLGQGVFRDWNSDNIAALRSVEPLLTARNRDILERFATARDRSLLPRLVGLVRSGVHRQTLLGNAGLVVAALFGRI